MKKTLEFYERKNNSDGTTAFLFRGQAVTVVIKFANGPALGFVYLDNDERPPAKLYVKEETIERDGNRMLYLYSRSPRFKDVVFMSLEGYTDEPYAGIMTRSDHDDEINQRYINAIPGYSRYIRH